MGSSQIVVVTRMGDAHTDDLITILGEMGEEVIRLNTDDIPQNLSLSVNYNESTNQLQGLIDIHTNGREIDLAAVRSVWWRRPGLLPFPTNFSLQERAFARKEISHVLNSIWNSLSCYWISHPNNIRQASYKGEQLQRAAKFGFATPRTLITTSPWEARKFFEYCGKTVVYKILSDSYLAAEEFEDSHPEMQAEAVQVSTTLITEAESELLDSVYLVPCQFQEYVQKRYEYRVTIIGEEVFVAEIRSQERNDLRIDWRNFDFDHESFPIQVGKLPKEIEDRCLRLVKSYGLNFGAIDLILTPNGNYVFLEINPNGQFIFLEKLLPELVMSRTLAQCLVAGKNLRLAGSNSS